MDDTKINADQMIQLLLDVCPSFEAAWRDHLNEYCDEPEPLYYFALGDFARHLIELLKSGKTEAFPPIFEIVEQLHVNGDAYVAEAATIGLLESIQNICQGQEIDPDVFKPFLGLVSKAYWKRLNRFWDGIASSVVPVDD